MPRSLQQRINAFDLAPSAAVATPDGSKKVCSPRATETRLRCGQRALSQLPTHRPRQTRAYSRETALPATDAGPLGARPQPPGPNARLRIRRYSAGSDQSRSEPQQNALISGKYTMPSARA